MKNQMSKGIVLLESLIAMLLLTIGVLAVISMEANLLNYNSQAQFRLRATLLGAELIALVNANKIHANCYVVPINNQTNCSDNAAKNYTTTWLDEVTSNLPGATLNPPIATLANDGTFTVTLFWQRQGETTLHNFTAVTQVGN